MIKKKNKKIIIIGFTVVMVIIVICGLYLGKSYHADERAREALRSDYNVVVEQNHHSITFKPTDLTDKGFIFYPGGKVEYIAYAPLLHQLAQSGIQCILMKMPFNLAVFDMNAADKVLDQYPEITKWYIGGHSLGGSMAASYIAKDKDRFEGLILLAAYSIEDLTQSNLEVLSIYGSEDGILNMKKYKDYRSNLPKDTIELVIEGGNHAQFGSYGVQKGDGIATISQEEQISQTAYAIENLIS